MSDSRRFRSDSGAKAASDADSGTPVAARGRRPR